MSLFSPRKAGWLAVAYVAAVLIVDTLASQDIVFVIHWHQFDWKPTHVYRWLAQFLSADNLQYFSWLRHGDYQRFEVFKFVFWFLIPFIACLPWMAWRWFGWRQWRAADWALVFALALAGMLAMLLIPEVESLRQRYPGMSMLPLDIKLEYFVSKLFWIVSWLIGWEFLHRYVLLRAGMRLWPGWGWIIVPLSEGLYHLQKPLLEAAGMLGLSIILTQWTLRRGGLLLPLLVHLIIEIELLLFLLFV
ncbi:MAG: hypothetical protein R3352_02550 [Salinisphaeraceae bacterium]|nr:hypothetical protein [Salinisphaeraceae bacterium]